jgi:hypothetical protein
MMTPTLMTKKLFQIVNLQCQALDKPRTHVEITPHVVTTKSRGFQSLSIT